MDQVQEAARSGGGAGWLASSRDYVLAAQAEMKKVTWPTREELIKATRMIVILSIALGVAIGLVDVLLNLIFVKGVAALAQ